MADILFAIWQYVMLTLMLLLIGAFFLVRFWCRNMYVEQHTIEEENFYGKHANP